MRQSTTIAVSLILSLFLGLQTVASSQIGAVYQLSNSLAGNSIVVWSLTTGGNLTYFSQVATTGLGSGGGTDALGSQYPLVVVGNNLFAVNANSSTISYFTISSKNATALTLVGTAATYGTFPTSVTATLSIACALAQQQGGAFRCWTITSSGLVALSWDRNLSNYTLGGTVSQISFTPASDALVISVRGVNATTGLFLVYAISGNNLAANPFVLSPSGAVTTFGFDFLGSQNTIVAADPHGSSKPGGVDVVSFTSATGAVIGSSTFQSYATVAGVNTSAPCWSVYSPVSNSFLVFDAATFIVSAISVNSSNSVSVLSYVNATKTVLDADYVLVNSSTEIWFANAPTTTAGAGPGLVVLYVNAAGVQSNVLVAAAPTSVGLGTYAAGVATYLQASTAAIQASVSGFLLVALFALYMMLL